MADSQWFLFGVKNGRRVPRFEQGRVGLPAARWLQILLDQMIDQFLVLHGFLCFLC